MAIDEPYLHCAKTQQRIYLSDLMAGRAYFSGGNPYRASVAHILGLSRDKKPPRELHWNGVPHLDDPHSAGIRAAQRCQFCAGVLDTESATFCRTLVCKKCMETLFAWGCR